MKKRVLSLLLTLCLLCSLPLTASARGINRYQAVLEELSKQNMSRVTRGLYYDINGDGIEELLIVRVGSKKYTTVGVTDRVADLYGIIDGEAECLLKEEYLLTDVGGPTASLRVVVKDGQTYLAATGESGATSGPDIHRAGSWNLFAMDPATDTLVKKFDVDYRMQNRNNVLSASESYGIINGQRVSYAAFEAWKKSLSTKVEISGYGSGGQSLSKLLSQAKADTTGDLPITSVAGFRDVKVGAYYADPVAWAVENGITNGAAPRKFNPGGACTRGQIVTFLWRACGSPEPEAAASSFSDVQDSSQYYYKAALWAAENGITDGTGGGMFSPNKTCTRDQAVTFLWRSQGEPEAAASSAFTDVKPGGFYEKAVNWAVENNITSGTGGGKFSPGKTCTRGEIVTFLYRAEQ